MNLGPDDLSGIETAGAGRLIGRRIAWRRRVVSTMDEALAAAGEGAEEGLVVLADEQTGGRGRHNRAWLSQPGRDVLLSVFLRPTPPTVPQLHMVASLAAALTIEQISGTAASIKWPNDVRVGGRKICGVLAESHASAEGVVAILGIGLNVNQETHAWPEIAETATSLREVAGAPISRKRALLGLLWELDRLYARTRAGDVITAEWKGRLDTLGQEVEVAHVAPVGSGGTLHGLAEGVDRDGRLLVRDAAGRLWPLAAGEVTLQGSGIGREAR